MSDELDHAELELPGLVAGAQAAAAAQTMQGASEFAAAIVAFHDTLFEDGDMPLKLVEDLTREFGYSLLPLRRQVDDDE